MANRMQDPDILAGKILSLDLGASCGWALGTVDGHHAEHGVWRLGSDTESRIFRLEAKLHSILGSELVAIYYEAPHSRFHKTMRSLSHQEAIVLRWARLHDVPCNAVPAAKIKSYATSNGAAGKPLMRKFMADAYRLIAGAGMDMPSETTEHEIDALWLFDLARSEIAQVPVGVD